MQETQENIQQALAWRYATKRFDPEKKLEQSTLDFILEVARLAPSAYGLQPFKLIHVQDKTLRQRIQEEAAFGQPQVVDASDFFVIVYRTDTDETFVDDYIKNISTTRNIPVSSLLKFEDTMKGDITTRSQEGRDSWAGRQSYIALGMMLETAALLKVDACPMEGFMPDKVDELLHLSEKKLKSVGFLALGYRLEDDMYATLPKVRISKDDFIISL